MKADLNVLDMANLKIEHPYISHDILPTGAKFWTQDVAGYDATIISVRARTTPMSTSSHSMLC
eukprot:SAG11_NODE_230_length_11943_cov_73.442962_5_plen_63_part_00